MTNFTVKIRRRLSVVAIVAGTLGFVAENSVAQVEEIIVTATKRETSLQETGIAISVFDQSMLDLFGIQNVVGLGSHVPSLTFGQDNNDWKVTLRGVGSENLDITSEAGVALHVDGVYQARPAGFNALTYDIERIEVLRGPQGTLYGRNATGGAINIITRRPGYEFSALGDFLVGDYNRTRARAAINIPLVEDTLAFRATATMEDRDGYQTNVNPDGNEANDVEDTSIRGQLLWDVSENLSVIARASQLRQRGVGPGRIRLASPPNSSAPDGNFTPDFEDKRTVFKDQLESRTLDQTLYSLEADLGLSSFETTLTLGYTELEYDMIQDSDVLMGIAGVPGGETATASRAQTADQFTAELRINSLPDSPVDWLVGVFYLEEDSTSELEVRRATTAPPFIRFPPFSNPPGSPGIFRTFVDNDYALTTTSTAVYGDISYDVSDVFTVSGGLRYTKDEREGPGTSRTEFLNFFAAPPPTWRRIELVQQELSDSWSKTTWKLGADWKLSDNNMLYATASTGFRSGGFNFGVNEPGRTYYVPEDLLAFELGSKNIFYDGRLQLNLAAFYYDYQDFQVFQLIDESAFVQNAAEAEIYGVEGDFVWSVSEGFQIDGQFSLMNATFTEFLSEDQVFPDGPDGIPGSGDELFDVSGNDMTQAPQRSGLIGLQYTFPIGQAGSLTLRGQIYAQSETYMRQFNLDPYDRQDGFTKTDITFRFESADGKWNLFGGVENLEDEDVVSNIDVNPTGLFFANLRPPRIYYLGAGVNF